MLNKRDLPKRHVRARVDEATPEKKVSRFWRAWRFREWACFETLKEVAKLVLAELKKRRIATIVQMERDFDLNANCYGLPCAVLRRF